MSQLVREAEVTKPRAGCHYGLSLYKAERAFEAVFHSRIYEGVKVASKWDSAKITLAALTKETAWEEAVRQLNAFIRSIEEGVLFDA